MEVYVRDVRALDQKYGEPTILTKEREREVIAPWLAALDAYEADPTEANRIQLESARTTAQERLVASCLPYVVKVAGKWKCSTGLEPEDLVQAGNIGLLHARDNFDPKRGNRFLTLAASHVLNQMTRTLRSSFLVKLPINLQELISRRSRPGREKVTAAGWTEEQIEAARVWLHGEKYVSPLGRTELKCDTDYHKCLTSSEPAPEEIVAEAEEESLLRQHLERLLVQLPPRWTKLLRLRYLTNRSEIPPHRKVARRIGCHHYRAAEIERHSLNRLRQLYRNELKSAAS